MATSLAEQLKRLETPQTRILIQDKKRPSLLFDPKEAANLDRESVLEIGQNGLQGLVELCRLFRAFEGNLFAQSSLTLERSVKDAQVNKKLDKCIEEFLILLSPYFLLNTAHKALEWLINRFRIHEFNKDQFLMLILPYHETCMFVRALQLVNVSSPSDKWHWLKPLQKPGIPLSTITLVNRVGSDNALLALICNHVSAATKVYKEQAGCLSTLYAFYTTAIVGAIDQSNKINDVQFNHMLPSLVQGLPSPVLDFAASSYMLLAKIATKATLNSHTLRKLLTKVFINPVLKQEAVLLLVFLYEAQNDEQTLIPIKLISQLSKQLWFPEMLAKLKSSGVNVTKFSVFLLESCLYSIRDNPEDTKDVQTLVSSIFERIQFKDDEVDLILRNILKTCLPEQDNSKKFSEFYTGLFLSLERQYSTRFDAFLKDLVKLGETQPASKKALHFLTSCHASVRSAKGSLDILDRLNHISPEQRIAALELLATGKVQISESYQDMIRNALLARFKDDEVGVVLALLSFPMERLEKLFTTDTLVDELLILLSKSHTDIHGVLMMPALKILLKLCKEEDDTRVFITVLPCLFLRKNGRVDVALQVLKSNFAKRNPFMQQVMKDVGESPDAESISSAAFHNVLKWDLLPPIESVLSTMKQQKQSGDAVSTFFNLILLSSVSRVPVGSLPPLIALDIIEVASEKIKAFPHVTPLPGCNQLNGEKISDALELTSRGILPLQVGTNVFEMVHRRLDLNVNPQLDLETDRDRSQLVIRLLSILFEGMSDKRWCKHYSWCLKIFFKRHFAKVEDMLCFLSQLFTRPVSPQISLHCLQISQSVLSTSQSLHWVFHDSVFTPNLLSALASENTDCRRAAVEILKKLSHTFNLSMDGFWTLLHELAARKTEISMDSDQLSLVLYTLLSPDPDVQHQLSAELRPKLQESLRMLLETIVKPNTPIHTISQLLDILNHVNGVTVLETLAPLGISLLDRLKSEKSCQRFAGSALKNILQRFDVSTVHALNNEHVWQLFERSMANHVPQLLTDTEFQSPSIILIKQINEDFFNRLGKTAVNHQKMVLASLLDAITDCEVSSVLSAASRAVRRIRIDGQLIIDELCSMKNAKAPELDTPRQVRPGKRCIRKTEVHLNPQLVNSREWRRGIILLEFVQGANNIEREGLLLPALFDLLRMCLRFEEQSPLEYTKQLLLSSLCYLVAKPVPITDADLYIDCIAQCIRTSQNPQTHHHALLVLVELFKLADEETALYNIMPIFTFMGSSVLRQDDAYSIQIISKTIETIIPIVNAASNEKHACGVLRIFITSLPDIPEHRRAPLFVKLLQFLEHYLYLFFLLTFESHVLSTGKQVPVHQMSSEKLAFALNISQEFSPLQLIDVCVKIVKFARDLPVEKEKDPRKIRPPFRGAHIFDVDKNTARDLRHYKYTLIQFLSALLSAPEFVNRIAALSVDEVESMKNSYNTLIEELVLLILAASGTLNHYQGKLEVKYWKVLLHHLYNVLESVNNLLPNKTFIDSIKRLIKYSSLPVRRKALELFNTRLQQKQFLEEDREDLLTLVEPLVKLNSSQTIPAYPDYELAQQTALISLKLLIRQLAAEDPKRFKPLLEWTTDLIQSREGPILASAVLCLAELCSTMRAHAIQYLNKFIPTILGLLRKQQHQGNPDVLVVSLVSALKKIVESLGNFLSSYLDQLLYEVVRLSSLYPDSEQPEISAVATRLKATAQKLSNCVPLRVLLPAVNKTYCKLIADESYKCVGPLMNVLAQSFTNLQQAELNAAIQDLASFFLEVLQFREVVKWENCEEVDNQLERQMLKDVAMVEESAGKALVALVLKLSEATFRPLYYRLYGWAADNPHQKQRNITFYRLSANIAECLKSLFVLFAGHFLKHAASLLTSNNLSVIETSQEFTLPLEAQRVELIEAILLTLHRVFTYDAHNFVNQERYQTLAQPIIDQIENVMGGKEDYERRARELMIPCIASFAGAIQDDSLHKQLVYQTLLKTRHDKPHVRSAALSTLVEVVRKLGPDFMPLLPETVPFLAELLEDEDEATEKLAQDAVRTLEEILGEPLQKYF